jgi:hypothetical protein
MGPRMGLRPPHRVSLAAGTTRRESPKMGNEPELLVRDRCPLQTDLRSVETRPLTPQSGTAPGAIGGPFKKRPESPPRYTASARCL